MSILIWCNGAAAARLADPPRECRGALMETTRPLEIREKGARTMSAFQVHTVPGSPFARAVLATLEEKTAPYAVVAVAPGTLKSEVHLALHPFGRVPVLEHNGFRLYETQAILRYLD